MSIFVDIEKKLGAFSLKVRFEAGDETLALLGASGCGKSMTLKCIAGMEKPDSGRIVVDGTALFDSRRGVNLPPQRRHVGLLFQNYALFPNMTVAQNILVGAKREKDRAKRKEAAERMMGRFGLSELAGRYPSQLSGGQMQRAALARILVSAPRVLLLDEPFSALDSFLKWQLEQELREVLDRFPGPVVWVSHDRGEVCRNCPRVCVLDAGRSSPVMDMADLMTNPGTVSAARLSGCRDFVPTALRRSLSPGLAEVPEWGLTLQISTPWRDGVTTLGLRAHHLHPAEAGEANAFPCQVVRVTEDASAVLAALRPEAAPPGAPPLWMELPKEDCAALPDRERLLAAVRPEDLMLLE